MTDRQADLNGVLAEGPLRVLFVITSMQVGGAETLLTNLVQQCDQRRIVPEICCLKERGPLGEELAREVPVHTRMIRYKYDVAVVYRLWCLLRRRHIDAVITVGAGDKMFWGRIAARMAGVPVILSALHSTGWPDGIGRLNRLLTRWTDRFIAVAERHGRYLIENERLPARKVRIIPNGVDTNRFRPDRVSRDSVRTALGIPLDVPVFGIVAALRPEKNHELFLDVAARILRAEPRARFLIVGDGPQRSTIQRAVQALQLEDRTHLLGTRADIPELLAAMDVFMLTSHQEANPVSILEALATGVPVVATQVGSIAETVHEGVTGYLADPGDADRLALRCVYLATHPDVAERMGRQGRQLVVDNWSLAAMVRGYEKLIWEVYGEKKAGMHTLTTVPVRQLAPNTPVRRETLPLHGE